MTSAVFVLTLCFRIGREKTEEAGIDYQWDSQEFGLQ